jgi:hypothetical protein
MPADDGFFSSRTIEWRVRKMSVDPARATTEDYIEPPHTWAVGEDGTLSVHYRSHILDWWNFDDVQRAVDQGYYDVDVDWYDVLVWRSDGGRGGDEIYIDLIEFLLGVGVELTLVQGYTGLRRIFRSRKRDKEARQIVATWANHGLASPFIIREWFDTKPKWGLQEVGTRLRISEMTAKRLLRALGYEPIRGTSPIEYTISARPKAQKRRQKWMRSETESEEPYPS